QHTAVVLVQHAGDDLRVAVSHGVEQPPAVGRVFRVDRQHLAEQGIPRITLAHAGHIGPRHTQPERCRRAGRIDARRRQLQQAQQLGAVRHRVRERGLPRRARLNFSARSRYHKPLFTLRTRPDTLMATYSTNQFKAGLKVMLDNDPCSILENEYVKPGKGQAFNRVKVRNLKTGRVIERTFKSGDSLEGADVVDTEMQFLYSDGEFWHFMNPETFEQIAASKTAVGDAASWL